MFLALGIVLFLATTLTTLIAETFGLTRASVPAAKVADTTRASSTQWCRKQMAEVPMPTVRKLERARHNCNRVGRNGGRHPDTSC